MNPALEYTRGTTYFLTHTYTAPTYLGATLLFGVKSVPNDTDPTDSTNAIMTYKRISMTGSSFPQTTLIHINPTDVAVTVIPGKYYYTVKVFDTEGDEFVVAQGTFQLSASTVNETS
jgi:hypothetical protein